MIVTEMVCLCASANTTGPTSQKRFDRHRGYLGKFEVGLFEGAGDFDALRALPDFPRQCFNRFVPYRAA